MQNTIYILRQFSRGKAIARQWKRDSMTYNYSMNSICVILQSIPPFLASMHEFNRYQFAMYKRKESLNFGHSSTTIICNAAKEPHVITSSKNLEAQSKTPISRQNGVSAPIECVSDDGAWTPQPTYSALGT